MIVFPLGAAFPATGVIVCRRGTPRPEGPTLSLIHVRPGVRGDDEDGVSMPGRRTEVPASAEPVAYAIDPAAHLSPTPPTPIDDVDGVADRPRNLSLA